MNFKHPWCGLGFWLWGVGAPVQGCATKGGSEDSARDPHDTGSDGDTGVPGTIPARTLHAEATFAIDYDAEAEAGGLVDCSYARVYDGTELLDFAYLCPACAHLTRGTATITEGAACAESLTGDPSTSRVEWWGWSDDARLFRVTVDQLPLSELAALPSTDEAVDLPVSWTSTSELSAGGTMTLSAAGVVRLDTDPSMLLPDPWGARELASSCGWPRNNPGDLEMNYALELGSVFPNVRLEDQCGEPTEVWDFYGSWLVIDTSSIDCGPCRSMADESEAGLGELRLDGFDVRAITLLNHGLSSPMLEATPEELGQWVSDFGLLEPVLADRGFGYAEFSESITAITGEAFGYPSWVVVDPTMHVVAANVGYSDWAAIGDIIRNGG